MDGLVYLLKSFLHEILAGVGNLGCIQSMTAPAQSNQPCHALWHARTGNCCLPSLTGASTLVMALQDVRVEPEAPPHEWPKNQTKKQTKKQTKNQDQDQDHFSRVFCSERTDGAKSCSEQLQQAPS